MQYYKNQAKIIYQSGDLFAGIGKAAVEYEGTICKSRGTVKVDLNIRVWDDYDFHLLFDEYLASTTDGVLATIANNMAWSDQYFDVISTYRWESLFKEVR